MGDSVEVGGLHDGVLSHIIQDDRVADVERARERKIPQPSMWALLGGRCTEIHGRRPQHRSIPRADRLPVAARVEH